MVDLFGAGLAKWKTRHLSMGGKLTLIKSVLNFISIYALSVHILPVQVRNRLHSLMSKFL